MVFGKLTSQFAGNKASGGRRNPQTPQQTPSQPAGRKRSTGGASVSSTATSATKSGDVSRTASKAPSSTASTSTVPHAGEQTAGPSASAVPMTSLNGVVSSVEPIGGRGGGGASAVAGNLPAAMGGLGRGINTNSCIRPGRQGPNNKPSPPENPLIDDLLDELDSTQSDVEVSVSARARRVSPARKGGNHAAAIASSSVSKRAEPQDHGSATAAGDSNAPRGLNVAELTRGSSFDGFDAQGFARRRSSDAPASTSRIGAMPGGKEAFDTVATASQHFVHVLRMHDMDGYFSVADNTKEDEVKKALTSKTPQEVQNLVVSLMDILEEVRVARGRIGAMRGSFSHLEAAEKRAMSASMFSTMSTASLARPPVHETTRVAMAYDRQGNKMINRYTVLADLGQGAYGKVKLGREGDSGGQVAIKIIDKKHLKKKLGGPSANSDNALRREIAIMKKVRHRNCVSLYEVIDDPGSNKLYLIMDYVPNGPVVRLKHQNLMPYLLRAAEGRRVVNGAMYNVQAIRFCVRNRLTDIDVPLTEEEINSQPSCFCCKPLRQTVCALYLRQLVSGLRYMHKRNVVHHDIKPDNILLGVDHHVYLTDFGVSEILQKTPDTSDEKTDAADASSQTGSSLGGSSRGGHGGGGGGGGGGARLGGGTLLFTAPELLDPSIDTNSVDPYATDVWALGVTLYCMLFGFAPFTGSIYGEVVRNIREAPFFWSTASLTGSPLLPEWREVLAGMLTKDPETRWTLVKLKEYLDFPAFHLALQTSELEDSTETDGGSGASLTFGKHSLNANTPSPSVRGAGAGEGGSPSTLAATATGANGFPAISRVSSISTSHLHSFSSSLQPASFSTALTPSSTAVMSLAIGQVVPPAALSTSAAQAAERTSLSDGINQNKYMPWDMGVSEQDVRQACLTVQVDMVAVSQKKLSPRAQAIVENYVSGVRARARPQQRLFSATPRLKRTSSQLRADMDNVFSSAVGDFEDDILTDNEDDPLGSQPPMTHQWPKLRPMNSRERQNEQEASSRSSEVPLVPVAGTFHRVTGNSASSSAKGSPRTTSGTRRHSGAGGGGGMGSPLPGNCGISVNPNVNTRPMSRRVARQSAAHALLCGSQSLDAMLSMVELQSEGASGGSSDTDHEEDDEAMGPHAFTRTRLPSEGTDKPAERKFLSISHATPDCASLDDAAAAAAAATQPHSGEASPTDAAIQFKHVQKPSVADLQKATTLATRQLGQGPTSFSSPALGQARDAADRAAAPSPSPSFGVSSPAGASTAAQTHLPDRSSTRPSLSCSPRPSTRKPVTVQKLASASAPGHLPSTSTQSKALSASAAASSLPDTKQTMLRDDDKQQQRQLSGGRGRWAATRDSSFHDTPNGTSRSHSTASGASSGVAVLTAWERKSRR